MSKSGYVDHLEGRYIDVLKRTKEYFKAPGVFRILRARARRCDSKWETKSERERRLRANDRKDNQ